MVVKCCLIVCMPLTYLSTREGQQLGVQAGWHGAGSKSLSIMVEGRRRGHSSDMAGERSSIHHPSNTGAFVCLSRGTGPDSGCTHAAP